MTLDTPELLLIIPAYTLVIAVALFLERRKTLGTVAATLARLLVVSLLVAALAGPAREERLNSGSILVAVDISGSMTTEQGQETLSKAMSLAQGVSERITMLPFARKAAPAAIPTEQSFTRLRSSWEKLDTGGSNLEGAVSSLMAVSNGPVLFVSDGHETEGKLLETLEGAHVGPIYPIVPPPSPIENQVTISQLNAPLVARAQKSVDIRTTITNGTTGPLTGTVTLKHGDKVVYSKQHQLAPNSDLPLVAPSEPSLEGLNEITATFSWADTRSGSPMSVTRTIWLSGEKRDKVLLLSGTREDDRFLSQILVSQAYQLRTEIAGSPQSPADSPDDYKVVVLNNVAKGAVPRALLDALPSYVRGGGGLVMIGGNQSFGLGGYIDSPIEDVLPVKLVPPQTEKKRLNVAVQLVIDKSRSMATDNRLDFAKSAAAEMVKNLKDEDFIGVIGFDEIPFIALPLSLVREVRSTALDRINRLYATRRTNLFPAMDEGRRALMRVNAGRKHMLVLTDGKIPDPGDYYFELVRQMRILGVTVSTVLVGDEADDGLLAGMAEKGGGSFYQTADPRNLLKIFLNDVKVSTGEKTLKESSEFLVRRGPAGVTSTSLDSFPSLRGYVQTLPRSDSATELVIIDTHNKSYPLLASRRVDKGRSVAFTSDANGRWSANWLRWSGGPEFFSDIVESVTPKLGKRGTVLDFELRSWVEGSELVTDLTLFEDPSGERVGGEVIFPDGTKRSLDFTPLERGHYQTRLPRPLAGKYRGVISVGDSKSPEIAWSLPYELFGERVLPRPNSSLLEQLALATGGKVNPTAEDLASSKKEEVTRTPVVRWFLILALLLFFAEIAAREFLRLPRLTSKRTRIDNASIPTNA